MGVILISRITEYWILKTCVLHPVNVRSQGLWEEYSSIGSNIHKVTAVGGNLVQLETVKVRYG